MDTLPNSSPKTHTVTVSNTSLDSSFLHQDGNNALDSCHAGTDGVLDELADDFQRKVSTIEIKNAVDGAIDLSNGERMQNATENFDDGISEMSRFVLASTCALSMNELFEKNWDLDFCSRSIKLILTNLQLPPRVEPVLLQFINGDNEKKSLSGYVQVLNNEPEFQNREKLKNIIFSFITLSVHEGKYDARWRVLIQYLGKLFEIKRTHIDEFEQQLVSSLLQRTTETSEEQKKKANSSRFRKRALIGLAAVGGGALIGVTGGLAAPFVGAGIANLVGVSAVASVLGSVAGVATVGSLFGVAGGKLTQYRMKRRVGDIEEFEFCELRSNIEDQEISDKSSQRIGSPKELHVTIVISGSIKNKQEESFTKAWSYLRNGKEQYYLKYDSSYLIELGKAMEYIVTSAASFATHQALKFTLLAGVISAVAWPSALIGIASVIDNPWGVCLTRSAQAGRQMAEVLLTRSHGDRPVTLFGYSLGARVIYYCLMEMSQREDCEGIIQDAILIGAPCTAQANEWSKFTRVVAGRIVNGYSKEDWILRFLYRTTRMSANGVAGLQKIELKSRKMQNEDLTDIIKGHTEYPEKMHEILTYIGDIPLAIRRS